MKWNPKNWMKKEEKLEGKAGEEITNLEDKVNNNNKLYWGFALIVAIAAAILMIVLYTTDVL